MSKEIAAKKQNTEVTEVVSDAGSMLSMIGRMSADPACDIDKIERLLKAQSELQERENKAAFNAVMANVQMAIEPVIKNRENKQTGSLYADLSAIIKMILPIASKHGISTTFNSGPVVDGCLPMTLDLSGCGHTKTLTYDSPLTDKSTQGKMIMIDAHARKSAFSYGRNILLCMAFNIPTVDDDGNGTAPQKVKITDAQVKEIDQMIADIGVNRGKFMGWLKTMSCEHIRDINIDFHPDVIRQLKRAAK